MQLSPIFVYLISIHHLNPQTMIYTIEEGKHFTPFINHFTKFPLHIKKRSLHTTFSFNMTNRYQHPDPTDQQDTNKLVGLSWGYHMKDSFRIGYFYNPSTQLYHVEAYIHNNYQVSHYPLLKTKEYIKTTITTIFLYQSNLISISIGDTIFSIPFNYPTLKVGYYLYPYFGGNNPSPRNQFYQLDFQ